MNAKIPKSALNNARRSGCSTRVRSKRYEMSTNQSTNVEVSRASQVHQIPQTGCAQIGPVTSTTVVNTNPTSAAETASQSQRSARRQTYMRFARKQMKNVVSPVQALDTCR